MDDREARATLERIRTLSDRVRRASRLERQLSAIWAAAFALAIPFCRAKPPLGRGFFEETVTPAEFLPFAVLGGVAMLGSHLARRLSPVVPSEPTGASPSTPLVVLLVILGAFFGSWSLLMSAFTHTLGATALGVSQFLLLRALKLPMPAWPGFAVVLAAPLFGFAFGSACGAVAILGVGANGAMLGVASARSR